MSGKLFTLYLSGCLNHLRATLNRPNLLFTEHQLSLEMGYVDDIEFIDQNKSTLEAMLPKVEMVFKDWNLIVNPNKTDFIDVIISENKSERGNIFTDL